MVRVATVFLLVAYNDPIKSKEDPDAADRLYWLKLKSKTLYKPPSSIEIASVKARATEPGEVEVIVVDAVSLAKASVNI